tara:strand:- start:6 stop:167 length:162 start_codon:yes stop_codon:yes gene_type:complete
MSKKSNLERIKEVLNLEQYRKNKKKEFRRRILASIIAILLIGGVIWMWYNGYV